MLFKWVKASQSGLAPLIKELY
ncbi:uncharacterized protein FTOL_13950 [Fusarium torulosum]|uniref:Uncharacterized protein n=1 Tax=Fusarium torulosum TaxID=33205 RepID=A0AAE8SQG6_9HYPO|nr:uncharacterized protein FTOL_13950 [Fusarium torulosum]